MLHKKINPSPEDLSDNESRVQRFVEQYIFDHHKSPMVREISAEVGLSVGGTHKVIQRLTDYGYLKKRTWGNGRRTWRNLRVLRYLDEARRVNPRLLW